jgi:hypothetical protein
MRIFISRAGFSSRRRFFAQRISLGVACALVLLAWICFASPVATADEIVAVAIPTVTFIGNSVCGPAQNQSCVETLSGSFEWDNTTAAVVPGTALIVTSGPLGAFSFYKSLSFGFGPSTLVGATYTNSLGDALNVDLLTTSSGLTPGSYPVVGPSQLGDAGVGLGCNESPVDQACFSYFLNPGAQEFALTPMVVTAAPESSTSSTLVVGGLMVLLALRCRRPVLASRS